MVGHLALTLATATGLPKAAEVLGVIVAAALGAVAIVAPSVRARAAAMLGALAAAPVLLLADIWNSAQVHSLRDRPAVAGALVIAGLVVVAAIAVLMRRRPQALPLLAVAALPFRIPISAGGSTASLLVPLYVVVAGGVLGHALPRLLGSDDDAPHPARALEWLLAGYLVLYGVQAAWSADFEKALQQVAFFYIPFSLLFCLLREVEWTPRLVAGCLGILVALAVIFVGVGFVEYSRKQLFLNPRIIAANEFSSYFRVNSLFFDPNIYGRFLAMVMLALATVALWRSRLRDVLAAGALLALLWAGLILTLSQSSFAALLAGLAVLAALRWSVRWTVAATLAALVVGGLVVLVGHSALKIDLNKGSAADRATSGRTALISGGWRLFEHRPVLGWGSAAFALQYRAHESASSERAVSASHTIPVTVAAEQGIVGLAVYLALLAAALGRLFAAARERPLRAFGAAAFVGLLLPTMLYAAFLEDPTTWVLLAVGVATAPAVRRRRRRRREPSEVTARRLRTEDRAGERDPAATASRRAGRATS